ncbi:DUF4302 domain-containing protein [Pedobacter steynii]|uniref:DUF4302 domain-containing protein n=1 Tax=Pedobacter steynii TaxID=430522 RepID=A0A1D7QGC7_9SPHI|nr:DUF4302 domain-containing protein [Pedobacter steynii]AOM77748.1 hypothetical protein BFS30_11540 [Pedobacter steynii]
MKKILIIGLFVVLGIQACKKDQELVDNQKPEERISESLEKYKKELVGSANGWKGFLYTTAMGGGYSFYMNFGDDGRVTMRSDFDADEATESKGSTFQLKQVMAPTLIFDTYNYLHLLSDPSSSVFGGIEGQGYGSDFEFEIREQVGDTLKLVGKKRNTEFVLVKATAAEKAFYNGADYPKMISDVNQYLVENPFLFIPDPKDNAKKIQVSVKPGLDSRSFLLNLLNGGVITGGEVPLSFSPAGFRFRNPLSFQTANFLSLDWDKSARKLFLNTSGGRVEVKTSTSAIIPLHLLIGTAASSFGIPGSTPLPGSSDSFIAGYNSVKTAAAGFNSTISDFSFDFNKNAKTFVISFTLNQQGNLFAAVYTYDYTQTENGEFKFSGLIASGGAGPALLPAMRAAMLNRFDNDTFTVDYYNDLTTGRLLGKMTSKEQPGFNFTGVLR